MDSEDYKKLVFDTYHQKLKDGSLSLNLIELKPAGLRDQCLEECKLRFNKKDERALKAFFGFFEDQEGCIHLITHFDINKFKPLATFLRGDKPNNSKIKRIEILAWLLDLKQRPYEFGKRYIDFEINEVGGNKTAQRGNIAESLDELQMKAEKNDESVLAADYDDKSEEQSSTIFKNTSGELNVENDEKESDNGDKLQSISVLKPPYVELRTKNSKKRNATIAIACFILFAILGYGTWVILKPKRYMYWAGTEYKEMVDSVNTKGGMVVAYDPEKIAHFKKVIDLRSINQSDIKRIWYAKFSIDDSLECFTGEGNHPVDTNRRLKPLTDYMYKTHILPLKAQP